MFVFGAQQPFVLSFLSDLQNSHSSSYLFKCPAVDLSCHGGFSDLTRYAFGLKRGKKKSSFSCCQLMIKRKQAALSIYLCSFSLWGGSWAVMETPPVSQTWSMTHLFYNNCSQICVSFNLSAAAVAQSLSCESQPRPPSGFSNSLVRPEPQGKRIPTPQQADGRFPGRQWFCCIRQQNNKRESFKHLVTNQVSCSVFLPVLSLDEQSKDGVFTVIYGEEPVEGQLGWHRTVLCYDLWKLTSVVCVINI